MAGDPKLHRIGVCITAGNTHQHLVQPRQRNLPPRASPGERPEPLGRLRIQPGRDDKRLLSRVITPLAIALFVTPLFVPKRRQVWSYDVTPQSKSATAGPGLQASRQGAHNHAGVAKTREARGR